ncbi:MAG TPA: hypothetical protein VK986_04995, partial [Tepidisphaeraceae bacterium]|nr:hypothetical protein [Tepidisphaeraceae bacterium]
MSRGSVPPAPAPPSPRARRLGLALIAIALSFLAWRMLPTPAVPWAVVAIALAALLVESLARRCPARP